MAEMKGSASNSREHDNEMMILKDKIIKNLEHHNAVKDKIINTQKRMIKLYKRCIAFLIICLIAMFMLAM